MAQKMLRVELFKQEIGNGLMVVELNFTYPYRKLSQGMGVISTDRFAAAHAKALAKAAQHGVPCIVRQVEFSPQLVEELKKLDADKLKKREPLAQQELPLSA